MSLSNFSTNSRLKKVQDSLGKWRVDACLIENPVDLFYLTGLRLSAGKLIVTREDACLFVDGRYLQAAREAGSVKSEPLEAFENFFNKQTVAFDSAATSYARFIALQKLPITLTPVAHLLKHIRAIKEKEELTALRKSAQLLWECFQAIQLLVKVGVSEKEIAREFEILAIKKGAQGLAFEPIIAFGVNGAYPHYRAGDAKYVKGEPVLFDLGLILNGYCSDMTRVVLFPETDPEIKQMYALAQEAQKAALRLCKPGVATKELDLACRAVFEKAGMLEHYLHSLGHGVGLEVHEFPRLRFKGEDQDELLQACMVVTVEPGLYLPGKGGVRYEDTIVITQTGYENFYPEW